MSKVLREESWGEPYRENLGQGTVQPPYPDSVNGRYFS